MSMFKTFLAAVFLVLFLPLPAHADREADCKIAYALGDSIDTKECQALKDKVTARIQQNPQNSNPMNVSHIWAGAPTPQDYTDALNLLQPLAEQGDANAQLKIAKIFLRTCSQPYIPPAKPPCDRDALMKWSKAAAKNGNVEANYVLGEAYMQALKPDQAEGMKWWLKAAELGSEQAKRELLIQSEAKKNWEDAYFWASVEKVGHDNPSSFNIRTFRARLTADQVAIQDRRAAKWLDAHPITATSIP